jgi:hypothetical protein
VNEIKHKEIKLSVTAEEARLLAYQLAFDADNYEKQDQSDYAEFLLKISRRISDHLRSGPKPNVGAQGKGPAVEEA